MQKRSVKFLAPDLFTVRRKVAVVAPLVLSFHSRHLHAMRRLESPTGLPRAIRLMAVVVTIAAVGSVPSFAFASGWSIQSTPNPIGVSASALEGVSCPAGVACVGVGDVNGVSGPAEPLAEQWDGTAWTLESNPPGQYLTGVSCTSTAACTAVGPGAYRWDGTGWSIQSTPSEGNDGSFLRDVSCTAATACTAVGSYRVYQQHFVYVFTLVERWNGAAWSIQSTLNPNRFNNALDGLSCSSATACTAVGSGVNAPLAERWNGTDWTIQSTPKPAGTQPVVLISVSCPTATDCTAVGDYETGATGYTPLAEQWNGTAWSIQSIPTPSGAGGVLEHVSCVTARACIAVGWGSAGALVEQWNGTAWSIQPTPAPSGATHSVLSGVSCTTATTCTAVGAYTNSVGTQVTLAESYSR
jgi:hypothetical protein